MFNLGYFVIGWRGQELKLNCNLQNHSQANLHGSCQVKCQANYIVWKKIGINIASHHDQAKLSKPKTKLLFLLSIVPIHKPLYIALISHHIQ